jgi:hypothetical protein
MKNFVLFLIVSCFIASSVYAAPRLWECHRCKQQYMGDRPPSFIKCPATNNTRDHWWIQR